MVSQLTTVYYLYKNLFTTIQYLTVKIKIRGGGMLPLVLAKLNIIWGLLPLLLCVAGVGAVAASATATAVAAAVAGGGHEVVSIDYYVGW